jgi:choline dehydrogenase-like flavoprotein
MAARRTQSEFDAIVVGSGITGGWAAKELTELGLRTLVLEAGRPVDGERDAVEHVPPWEMPYRGLGDRAAIERRQPVQRRSVSFDELSRRFWTDDVDNPYTTPADTPFNWFRARQVGGKSIIWGRQVYRWSDLDFEANLRDGIAVDWPIRYADVAPWYDRVERFIGVSGRAEGLSQLPDGQFQPPMAMNCVEEHVRDRMAAQFGRERVLTIGRVANLTAPLDGRAPCHYCGPCQRGCVTRSYFSSLNATLPAAQRTGRLTLRPFSIVHTIVAAGGRVTGVRVIDARTRAEHEYRARVVFLCASALESARILLHSTSASFPDGLANASGQVGRNVMDHIKGAGASGEIEGWLDRHVIGNRPNGIYVPRFRNIAAAKNTAPDFIRGYGLQGGAGREDWHDGLSTPGIGVALKERLSRLGPWIMTFNGYAECLPREQNRCTLDPSTVDAWGMPVLHIEAQWSPNELALHKDMSAAAVEILDAVGATRIQAHGQPSVMGSANHEMGTARMGRDPRTSVLNAYNRAHDIPNLYVTDGSCMTSSGWQNPSLTYMALTARACHHAADALARRDI